MMCHIIIRPGSLPRCHALISCIQHYIHSTFHVIEYAATACKYVNLQEVQVHISRHYIQLQLRNISKGRSKRSPQYRHKHTNVQYVIVVLRNELSHVNSNILWHIFLQITATVTAPEDKEQT